MLCLRNSSPDLTKNFSFCVQPSLSYRSIPVSTLSQTWLPFNGSYIYKFNISMFDISYLIFVSLISVYLIFAGLIFYLTWV